MICAACPCRNRSTIRYSSPGPLRTDTLYFAVAAAKLGVAVSLGVAVGGGMVGVAVSGTGVGGSGGGLRGCSAVACAVRRTSSLERVGVPEAPRHPANRLRIRTAPIHFIR